jgi:hypothetical protein
MTRDFEQIERLNYKDVRLDDKINELQSDVRHNRRQRLKNRVNERQNRFSVRQNS